MSPMANTQRKKLYRRTSIAMELLGIAGVGLLVWWLDGAHNVLSVIQTILLITLYVRVHYFMRTGEPLT